MKWSSSRACDACGYLPEWLAEPRQELAREKEKKDKHSSALPHVSADVDAELAAYVREWRREVSKREGVPAYVVMHDSSLEDLCRKRPRSLAEVRQVSGFGERKTAVYGREILGALERFARGARASQIAMSAQQAAMATGRNANREIGVPRVSCDSNRVVTYGKQCNRPPSQF